MAGDPRTAVLLLGLGVDELSVSCFDLPRVKAAIRSVRATARARDGGARRCALPSARRRASSCCASASTRMLPELPGGEAERAL